MSTYALVLGHLALLGAVYSFRFGHDSALVAQSRQYQSKQKVIIDSDAGVDDTQAILLALSSPNLDVIAITCNYGNTGIENVTKNVLRALTIAHRLDIPVFRGSRGAIVGFIPEEVPYFGFDGLGDVTPQSLLPSVNLSMIQQEYASNALIRLAKQYPGEIALICLAPLTNVAIAIKLDPDFTKNLKSISIMGGNNAGEGNETPSGEFNFYRDAEAAYIVFGDKVPKITVINWETCLSTAFYDASYLAAYYNGTSPQSQYIHLINNQLNTAAFAAADASGSVPLFVYADQFVPALVADDSICTKSANWRSSVELTGTQTRGQCVVDKRSNTPQDSNIRNCYAIDIEKVKSMLLKMVQFDFTAPRQ